jgi:hypothetical protein
MTTVLGTDAGPVRDKHKDSICNMHCHAPRLGVDGMHTARVRFRAFHLSRPRSWLTSGYG